MSRPNILFIIADQWAAVTADGRQNDPGKPQTPHIARLAREGTSFGQAYCPFPVCTPARAAMFSGNMPSHTRVINNHNHDADRVPADLPRLGRIFRDAGYDTGYFGKNHSAGVAADGFAETGQYVYDGPGYLACGHMWDPLFTRDAVEFVSRDRSNPFFCTLSLINPHDICRIPKGVPREDTSVADLTDRFNWSDEYLRGGKLPPVPTNHEAPSPEPMLPSHGASPDWDEARWRRFIGVYHLLIENTDWMIGLVLDALHRAGIEENTLVVFTTDHGDHAGAHRLVGKGSFFEESARVPLVARLPGQIAADRFDRDHGVSGVDLLPTFCDFAGLTISQNIDGSSLRPLMQDSPEEVEWREGVFCELSDGRMVRFGNYKYIRHESPAPAEFLFCLSEDPGETTNLLDASAHREARQKGRELLEQYDQQMGAAEQISNPLS